MKTIKTPFSILTTLALTSLVAACGHSGGSNASSGGATKTTLSVAQQSAELSKIAGVYVGPVVSRSSGQSLGTLQLIIQNSNGSSSTAILIFSSAGGSSASTLASGYLLQQLNYDPSSHQLSAQLPLKLAGQTSIVNFSSVLNDSMAGSLLVSGDEGYGADFNLELESATTPASAPSPAQPVASAVVSLSTKFTGTAFLGNTSQGATLLLQDAQLTSDEKIVSLLTPLKEFKTALSFANGSKASLSTLIWNQSKNTLTTAGDASQANLSCNLTNSSQNMICSVDGAGLSGATKLIMSAAVVAQPAPAGLSPIGLTPTSSEIFTFNGTAQFVPGTGKKFSKKVQLKAVQIAAPQISANSESVQLTFLIEPSQVGAKFDEATLNTETGDLQASQTLAVGATAGQLSLVCQQFAMVKKAYNFSCRYTSTINNIQASIQFVGK